MFAEVSPVEALDVPPVAFDVDELWLFELPLFLTDEFELELPLFLTLELDSELDLELDSEFDFELELASEFDFAELLLLFVLVLVFTSPRMVEGEVAKAVVPIRATIAKAIIVVLKFFIVFPCF